MILIELMTANIDTPTSANNPIIIPKLLLSPNKLNDTINIAIIFITKTITHYFIVHYFIINIQQYHY